jgi:ribonuclease P protein component
VEAVPLETLSRRADVRHLFDTGKRVHLQAVTVVGGPSPDRTDKYLFVAGKKAVGGAVARNRVKRRLRAVMRGLSPEVAAGWWIALIARPDCGVARFADLSAQVKDGLSRLGALESGPEAVGA